jgi:hypothetical protein
VEDGAPPSTAVATAAGVVEDADSGEERAEEAEMEAEEEGTERGASEENGEMADDDELGDFDRVLLLLVFFFGTGDTALIGGGATTFMLPGEARIGKGREGISQQHCHCRPAFTTTSSHHLTADDDA